MRTAAAWLLIASIACLVLSGWASASEVESAPYEIFYHAFRDIADRTHRRISDNAVRYLLDRLEVDWVIHRTDSGGIDVRGYVGYPLRFCILVHAKYDSCGQYGSARYRLIDGSGRTRWERQGGIVVPPRLSSDGTVELFSEEGPPSSGLRPDTLRLDFVDVNGTLLGTKRWGDRVMRPNQSCRFPEQARFWGRDLFVITLNLCRDESQVQERHEFNHTIYVAVSTDGRERWRWNLGACEPQGFGGGFKCGLTVLGTATTNLGDGKDDTEYRVRYGFDRYGNNLCAEPPGGIYKETVSSEWLDNYQVVH